MCDENNTAPIFTLPPEIFPSPSSILVGHTFSTGSYYQLHTAILYPKVIIKSENHVSQMLERISKDKELGSLIRELHLLVNCSIAAVNKRSGTTVASPASEHLHALFGNRNQFDLAIATPEYLCAGLQDMTALLPITFPHPKSLNFVSVRLCKTEDAMDFWKQHPGLEQLSINDCYGNRWFSDDIRTTHRLDLTTSEHALAF